MKITETRKPRHEASALVRVALTFGAWTLAVGCTADTANPAAPAQETPAEIASAEATPMPPAQPMRHPIDSPNVKPVAASPFVAAPFETPTPLALQRRTANKVMAGKDLFRHDNEAPRVSPTGATTAASSLELRTLMARQSAFLARERRLASENPDLSPEQLDVRRAALKTEMIGGAP
jgi:hypothetical protein